MDYANQIIDAIQTIAQNEVAELKFDKTIRATIVEAVDASIGKYKVRYQNSSFFAYALDLKSYNKGANVYVVIPSSDFNKDPYIAGTVKKLGADFVDVITLEDKMSVVGDNIIIFNQEIDNSIKLSSFKPEEKTVYKSGGSYDLSINQQALEMYKQDSEYLMIGAKFTTSIPDNQKIGSGDYGIRVVCKYWDSRYKSVDDAAAAGASPVYKSYVLNVKSMTGQPYNYTGGNEQHAVFPIDSDHLLTIDSISAFCQDFPQEDHTKPTDIIVSNLKIEFYDALSESEIQGISLRITTPHGGFFYQRGNYILPTDDDGKSAIKMDAILRVKGKRVNPEQTVSYYWFVRDDRIQTDSDEGYNRYGGPGWRCINTNFKSYPVGNTYKKEYLADQYSHYLPCDECPAYQTYVKCVAVFEQDSGSTIIDVEKVIYNSLKADSNNIYIESMMGIIFNFNTGLTQLTCRFKNEYGINYNDYDFVWTRSIDGQDRESVDVKSRILSEVDISLATNFVTYSCSVYEKTTDLFIGAAEITLSNQAVQGEYRLVLHNGTQVFKYDAKGVSPASPSVDEQSRLDLGAYALSFDIYDDKGQRIDMGNDENKHRIVDIKWIWPSTNTSIAPDLQKTDFESMLLPAELKSSGSNFILETIPSPYNSSNSIKRWVLKDQANLPYQIQSRYDSGKTNNTIQLEVTYKGYILTASTNFTFTKEGELGTNGTKYTARIKPNNYDKIVILQNSTSYGFYGVKGNNYTKLSNTALDSVFTVEVWDGGTVKVNTGSVKPEWTTARKDRNLSPSLLNVVKVNNAYQMQLNYNANYLEQNHTLKAQLTVPSISAQPFYCEYPIEVYQLTSNGKPSYAIEGGYKHCNYESDGTRSNFSTAGFKLVPVTGSSPVAANIKWKSKWNGDKYTVQIKNDGTPQYMVSNTSEISGYNNVVIEPPAYFEGEVIDNYISCRYNNTVVAVIPINLYLNKYGLSAINGWDGTSIKLNESGSNYILTPQMGAGKKESNGSFTGIVAGTSMDTDGTQVGLFGYNSGSRSILLDAQTGNAEFGTNDSGRIVIGPASRGIAPKGAIYSYNYYKYDNQGKPNALNSQGMLINLQTPGIYFGSGRFSVDSQGNLVAKGGGSIAGWKISDNVLTSNNNAVTLNSAATGDTPVFNANNTFKVYANGKFTASNGSFVVDDTGKITATSGTIGGFTIGATTLTGGNLILNSNGSLKHSGNIWSIGTDGVAVFTDVRIKNTTTAKDGTRIIDIDNGKSGDANREFYVTSEGEIKAEKGNIGGWSITPTSISYGSFHLNATGTVQLGSNYTFTDSGGSGKNNNQNGSRIGSGNVYSGGSGSGGQNAEWQDITLNLAKKSTSYDFTYVTSVDFDNKNAPTNTHTVQVPEFWTRTLRLLVQDKGTS